MKKFFFEISCLLISIIYKLYFKLNERRQLKIVIDTLKLKRITIRTIKILDRKLYKKIKFVRRG